MGMLRPFVGALVVTLALAGCAVAEKSGLGGRPDGGIHLVDTGGGGGGGDGNTSIDAPAAPGEKTLDQAMSDTDEQVGIACGPTNGDQYTLRNSYYRVFSLPSYNISGAFHVTKVDFVVSAVTAGTPLSVKVGTYSGATDGDTLATGSISVIDTTPITPGDGDTSEEAAFATDIPAGSNLIVEIDQTTKGSNSNGYLFYIGASTEGETDPGYISSPDCSGAGTPTSMTEEAGGEADEIITVTGTT